MQKTNVRLTCASLNSGDVGCKRGNRRRRKGFKKQPDIESNLPAPPSPELLHGLRENAQCGDESKDDSEHVDSRANTSGSVRGLIQSSDCGAASGSTSFKHGEAEVNEEDSAMRRLNALDLRDKHIGVAQNQHISNIQDQADEVLALEAIFGEDFVTLEAQECAKQAYRVCVNVEVPGPLDVMIKIPVDPASNEDARVEGSQTIRKIRACTLQFLAPLQLIYRPSPSYPSHCPPNFILSAHWLSKSALAKLCQGMDAVWADQVGDVVIYSWVEWLHTHCLSHLGISSELELGTCHGNEVCDCRVFSAGPTPDMIVPMLMRYNEDRKNEVFLMSLHTCYICFNEYLGQEFVRLPCKHIFCSGCMKQYTSIHVKEGTVKRLQCPDTSCKGSIPPSVLKQLLEEEEFTRWENLLLKKTLESMADIVYCPRCETVCIEDKDHDAQCTACLFNFCSVCRGPRHVGQECMSPEARLHILQARQQGAKSGEDRKRKEQDFVNEFLSLKYVKEEAKQCPSCRMAITKSEGCNKVTCGNCGQYFCYKCNSAIKGYDHFSGGCVLFDDEEIQRWNMLMNVGAGLDRRAPPDARGVNLHWRTCPNCRQENIKEGNNNHILCWSCQQHFCALCRKVVRRSSEHYGSGPNKCKQHTAD